MIERIILQIAAPPEKVFQFLCDYDKHYTEVSRDHMERVVNVKNPDLEHPDVSFYFRQISPITGKEQKIRGKVRRVEMNRYISTVFLFPVSLFLTKVEEILEPEGDGCLLITNLDFTLLAKLLKNSRRRVTEHIRGELVETKNILEREVTV